MTSILERVIVTGSNGFIGRGITRGLIDRGICTIRVSRNCVDQNVPLGMSMQIDLSRQEIPPEILNSASAIIHCAASDGGSEFKLAHAEEIEETNYNITTNILNSVRRGFQGRLFYLSSADVYSLRDDLSDPFNEYCHFTKRPGDRQKFYGWGKLISERRFQSLNHIPVTIVRPGGIFGSDDDPYKQRLLPKIISARKNGTDLKIRVTDQMRNFTYVGDFVTNLLNLAETSEPDGIFNIASTRQYSVERFVSMAAGILGVKLDMETINSSRDFVLDSDKAKVKIGQIWADSDINYALSIISEKV